jgi:hypothetical protein
MYGIHILSGAVKAQKPQSYEHIVPLTSLPAVRRLPLATIDWCHVRRLFLRDYPDSTVVFSLRKFIPLEPDRQEHQWCESAMTRLRDGAFSQTRDVHMYCVIKIIIWWLQ